MKKITLALLVMLAFCLQSNAQVTVGDGTYTSAFNTYPFNPYYGYSYAQSIYLASEINASGDITSISFEMANADAIDNSDDLIDLWIGHTTKTEFDTTSDWVDVTTLTQVMTSGTLTKSGTTITFTFSSPFTYNGTDNLIIALDANEDDYEGSSDVLIGTNVGTNRTIRQMSDSVNADPTAPPTGVLTPNVGNITFYGIVQSCPNPSELTATNITATQADLGWTIGASEGLWNIELGVAGFTPTGSPTASGVSNPYTAMSLASGTSYEYYVQADCTGGEVSGWVGPFEFVTECSVFTPEYIADMSTNVPNCWEEANSGDATTGPMEIGAGLWYASNHNGTPSNAINMFFNTRSDWIISPEFDLSSAAPSELKVYVALTESGTSGSDADLGSDDVISLLMTTDGGTTWVEMQSWTQGNVPTDVGEEITYDLSAVTGNVQFAFLGNEGTVNDPEDVYFHVSKFQVRETPSCVEPASLMNTVLTDTTSEFTWAIGGTETTWEYANLPSPSSEPASGTSTMVASASFNGLTPQTDYDFYVRSDCGSEYSNWLVFSYSTPATPPSNDDCSGAEALTVNSDYECGTVTSGTVLGATDSGLTNSTCFGSEDDDVWYSFVASAEEHRVSLTNVSGSVTDLYHVVYDGMAGCGALGAALTCSDGNTSNTAGLTIGNTYYVQVYTYTANGGQNTTFDICVGTPPPPPANDDCANATVAASLPYTNTQLDAAAATNNDGFIDPENGSCGTNGMNDGVWYTFTPSTTGVVDVSITNVSGWDPEVAIYSGSCGTFTCEGRADSAGSGGSETLSAIAVTSGVQYWINVGYYSDLTNSSEGPFQIDISDVTLGLDNVDSPAAFTYYPNPVKNTLNLNAQNTIEQVAMYNMLGQEVLRATPNAIDSELDMSSLQTGTYFVKVTIANVTKTIRVIKQ